MLIRGKYLIISEVKKPYIERKDVILCDMTEYPVPRIQIFIDNNFYDINTFKGYIESKSEIRWRSEILRKSMMIYYENLYNELVRLNRDEKINRLIHKELYNINNLALAC